MHVNLFVLLIACKNVDFSAKVIPVRLDNQALYLRVALATKEEIERGVAKEVLDV